jgi:hypothetical protein
MADVQASEMDAELAPFSVVHEILFSGRMNKF